MKTLPPTPSPSLGMADKADLRYPSHGQGHFPLSQGVLSSVQPGLGHFQEWGSHSFLARPHHPHREGFFGDTNPKAPLCQHEAIPLVLSLPAPVNCASLSVL